MVSPRDRFVTVYGRNPVLEVLGDRDADDERVGVARELRALRQRDVLREDLQAALSEFAAVAEALQVAKADRD